MLYKGGAMTRLVSVDNRSLNVADFVPLPLQTSIVPEQIFFTLPSRYCRAIR